MARVGLIFGGRSVEHEVSITSARTVAQGLREACHEVVPLPIGPDGAWVDRELGERALAGELDRLPGPPPGETRAILPSLRHLVDAEVDVVFPINHGTWGEDGTLQGFLEIVDLPYVGAGVAASAVAMNKALTKRLLEQAGVPVVPYETVTAREMERDPDAVLARLARFEPPLFVKPTVGGSSVGVKRVPDRSCITSSIEFALRFDDEVIVEAGIQGRELEVAVLGYEEIEASAVGEIVPGREFYDYEDKYLSDGAKLIAPAELPDDVTSALREAAVRAFRAVNGHGMARVDFLLEGETPYVNEINTLPGFTRISMYPRLWGLSGVPLHELVDKLVRIAIERHKDRHRLDEGIREWIAELESR
jgi:D-alanine-D-alanine ligase